jgi:hypothetical protein
MHRTPGAPRHKPRGDDAMQTLPGRSVCYSQPALDALDVTTTAARRPARK